MKTRIILKRPSADLIERLISAGRLTRLEVNFPTNSITCEAPEDVVSRIGGIPGIQRVEASS
jgi:hypothetical protein